MSLPPAPDMLAVIREFLETAILPGLKDDKWFNVKIATNMLATVERELRLGAAADAAEAERLTALTGTAGSLEELNRLLALRIRDGSADIDDPALLDHLRRSVADALRINNPQWLTR
ncbi:MAG TPA: DUF6285 domain-containing protein [Candidatus Cybelea sp.]|nr:DUF6285 domain-containing protein [Candidatus Cybelea sp.]